MSQTVIISLGNGDFEKMGFNSVRVTLNMEILPQMQGFLICIKRKFCILVVVYFLIQQ